MAEITKIFLVRHGQSESNLQGLISGQYGDPSLTDHGRRQAQGAKKHLKNITFDAVYSSDFRRASETAEIISGQPVTKENQLARLRERNFGVIDGKDSSHYLAANEAAMKLPVEERWHYPVAENAETDHELAERWRAVLEEIAQKRAGQSVLIAGHGSSIRTFLMKIGFATYETLPPGTLNNGTIVELDYNGKRFTVVRILEVEV